MNQSYFTSLLFSVLLCVGPCAVASGTDASHRCSLTDRTLVATDIRASFPTDTKAHEWHTVCHTFDSPVDMAACTMVEYGLLVGEGPGRHFDTRLTLISHDGKRFPSEARFIPTLWQDVIFDVHDCPFLSDVAAMEIGVRNHSVKAWTNAAIQIDSIFTGKVLDLDFDIVNAADRLMPKGNVIVGATCGAAIIDFADGASVSINTAGSRNSIYNPLLETRNTVAVAIDNRSTADSLKLTVLTDKGKPACKVMPMPYGLSKINFNLSDCANACGRPQQLTLEPIGGSGRLILDRISFEQEKALTPVAGDVSSCTATDKAIIISGSLRDEYLPVAKAIEIRHSPLWKSDLPFDSLELLASTHPAAHFRINDIPNSRLNGKMTHLSSRFEAALRCVDGSVIPIGAPFFITNWSDFISNPYHFDTIGKDHPVEHYGAVGDGITNDNTAIQSAIDAAIADGGGRVVLGGNHTYLATNLELGRGVTLVIDSGSTLRQSPYFNHYAAYPPEYGHDNVIPGIPWTHCMYTNRPLILAKDTDHVKITGGGTIRMDDVASSNPRWNHHATFCSDRIHIVPIAICNTKHVEISDIDIKRSNNYHTIFYRADSVFIGNLKMIEVACVSGDGLSFGNAVTNVRVGRCVFESNDDGIVLCSSYKDPRGGVWRQRVDSIDSSVRNIEVLSSYIDSSRKGAGKAIAIIPWGSTNPRQDYNEIDNIEVRDCVLRGGHSVGSWPDNPFDGKPFTNSEPDDYAPVKNLRIYDNEYLSTLDLSGVVPTTLLTDCGLKGSSCFKNDKFTDRLAYWTSTGNAKANEPGVVRLSDASIYQGLYLTPGKYKLSWQGKGKIKPFVKDASGIRLPISSKGDFEVHDSTTLLLGVDASDAIINSLTINNQ